MRLADYARRLLCLAETVHRWLGALSALDEKRRARVAGYAERIADTLARGGDALNRLGHAPEDGRARRQAIRELGRISGYIETMVGALTLTGASLPALKGAWSSSGRASCTRACSAGASPSKSTAWRRPKAISGRSPMGCAPENRLTRERQCRSSQR